MTSEGVTMKTIPSDRTMLYEYLDWLANVKRRMPYTVSTYRGYLESFLYHLDSKPLADATLGDMESWLRRERGGQARGRDAASSTIAKNVVLLRAFYSYCVDRGWLTENPAKLLGAPKVHNVNPRPVSDDAWTLLWKGADDGDRLMLGLGFYVGLRRNEMALLRGSHVDLAAEKLVGFTRKGGGDDVTPYGTMCRVVANKLPVLWHAEFTDLLTDVAKWRGERWLFDWADEWPASQHAVRKRGLVEGQVDPQHLNRRMQRLCASCGLDRREWTCHQLRHSCITNLIRAGVPLTMVSRLANHTDISTTMRYVKTGGDDLAEWLETHA
jgi:integrase/recombinase XerD